MRRKATIGSLLLALWLAPPGAAAQTLRITNDQGVALSGPQVVNVGEHVRLTVIVDPAGTPLTNPQWIITGLHIKDWVAKDADPLGMLLTDYLAASVHFVWKDTTTLSAPNIVRVSALVGTTLLTAQAPFHVERQPKPEKFYSDDLLMENHNNWHNVYMFSAASTRRGDLFLAWHRSQLEYFDRWRAYFGYPPAREWNPVDPWVIGSPSPIEQHPSTTLPASAFSTRHDLTTLDLGGQGFETPMEGEFDVATHRENRGTRPEFVAAGFRLMTETIREVLCGGPCNVPALARNGAAGVPTWWKANTGQTPIDPWFGAGCPALETPQTEVESATCPVQAKRSFDDYTFRELGESIESGLAGGWSTQDEPGACHAGAHGARRRGARARSSKRCRPSVTTT